MKLVPLFALLAIAACSHVQTEPVLPAIPVLAPPSYSPQFHDGPRALAMLEALSSDDLKGRLTGTPGNLLAQDMITARFAEIGLKPIGDGYRHDFVAPRFNRPEETLSGTNIMGLLEGTKPGGPTLVLSAHYDHVGERDGEIYNGADDNASGVAAMLEVAQWFADHRGEHDIIFVAFDAEEGGLSGAVDFVRTPPIPRERVAFNLNLDMVARADKGEIYAVGTYHFPELIPVVKGVAANSPLTLKMGHDRPEDGDQNWTLQSDHAPFIRSGIPSIYLGVEDHADYHRPTDEFAKIDPETFERSVDTIVMVAQAIDVWLGDEVRAGS